MKAYRSSRCINVDHGLYVRMTAVIALIAPCLTHNSPDTMYLDSPIKSFPSAYTASMRLMKVYRSSRCINVDHGQYVRMTAVIALIAPCSTHNSPDTMYLDSPIKSFPSAYTASMRLMKAYRSSRCINVDHGQYVRMTAVIALIAPCSTHNSWYHVSRQPNQVIPISVHRKHAPDEGVPV